MSIPDGHHEITKQEHEAWEGVHEKIQGLQAENKALKEEYGTRCDCCQNRAYPLMVVGHDLVCYKCLFEEADNLRREYETALDKISETRKAGPQCDHFDYLRTLAQQAINPTPTTEAE